MPEYQIGLRFQYGCPGMGLPVLYRNGDADVQQGQWPTQYVSSSGMEFPEIFRWLLEKVRRTAFEKHGDHYLRWQQNRVRAGHLNRHDLIRYYWYITIYSSAASNIVFSNGLQDPWSGGGVLRAPNNDIIIIIIPDSAHHLDLRSANANDPESVQVARTREKDAIRKWLRQSRSDWIAYPLQSEQYMYSWAILSQNGTQLS